jgi:hypothetical protein
VLTFWSQLSINVEGDRNVCRTLSPQDVFLRGWGAYFRHGNSGAKFSQLDFYVHLRARADASSSFGRLVSGPSVRVGCGLSHDGAREDGNLRRHWLSQERTRLGGQHRVSYSCRSARSSALRTVLRYRATLRLRSLRSTWCASGETRRTRMSVASSTLTSGWRAPWAWSA